MMSNSQRLLVEHEASDGADLTFHRILQCIKSAQSTIFIHMFVWRSDAIGNQIAEALLAAANRGVIIRIKKDSDALFYELAEMNRKPLFNKAITGLKKITYPIMAATFPNTFIEDSYDDALGKALLEHHNVTIEWVSHTHSKYYLFDNEILIIGSINIEDRHRQYFDYMAEFVGSDIVQRLQQRLSGSVDFDKQKVLDFVINRRNAVSGGFEIKTLLLQCLAEAKKAVYIEMAYIGDRDITQAIIQAANRGVKVTILFSKAANIANDINYKTINTIVRNAPVDVYFAAKMIHSKLMLFDDESVVFGSANLSVYSMQKGEELDVWISGDTDFLQQLTSEITYRLAQSEKVTNLQCLNKYNRVLALLQQWHQLLF